MAKKTLYNIDRLLDEGLLRKIPALREKAGESLRTAESWIKEAENNFRSKAFRSCIISSYLAMFHFGALLIDIVPFGALADEHGRISWPSEHIHEHSWV